MRLRNKTRDGMNWDRGVGTDEESRVGKVSSVEERSIGLERSDDFLRRTGPKLEEGRSAKWRSGIRDKSAISHGLVRSGAAWRVDIQGRWSKAWSGALTRPLALGEVRRRFGCCELGFERLLGDDRQGGAGVMHDSERWIGELRRCIRSGARGWIGAGLIRDFGLDVQRLVFKGRDGGGA